MPDTEPDGWERQQDGSYRNADGWALRMEAQGLWRIKRPNGFYADNTAYPNLGVAKRYAARHARFRVA